MVDVNCADSGCRAEGTLLCELCRFVFCPRHLINHSHGKTKGRGAGIS